MGTVLVRTFAHPPTPTMYGNLKQHLKNELASIEEAGLFKRERIITSEQGAEITVNGRSVLNFCANNYLGLSSHPDVVKAAHASLDSHGFGMSSVRFICGTQDIHKELEAKLSAFHSAEAKVTGCPPWPGCASPERRQCPPAPRR